MTGASWWRIAAGLVLGAAASFAAGCVYAYVIWDPPSNDWGNEKSSATILLAPVLVGLVVLAVLLRRRLWRLFAALRVLGRAGLAGALVGAVVLPAAELAWFAVEWSRMEAALPAERQAMAAGLDDIASRLKQAEAIVIEAPRWATRGYLDPFIRRLSGFAGKPVFVVLADPGGVRMDRLRQYQIADGPDCAGACLTGTEVAPFEAWPSRGVVLSIDADTGLLDDIKGPLGAGSLYPELVLATLVKPPSLPSAPYAWPYDFDAEPRLVWRNRCFVKPAGPFPFGRGLHWRVCAALATLSDAADRMFGPAPAAK